MRKRGMWMSEDAEQKESLFLRLLAAEMRKRFSEKVIEHANDPCNVGRMSRPDGSSITTGPCGDTMEFYVKARDDVIEDILFMTDGCGPTIAAGSMLTSMVKGGTIGKALEIGEHDLDDALKGRPSDHKHCAKLAVDTLRKAVTDIRKRSSKKAGITGNS